MRLDAEQLDVLRAALLRVARSERTLVHHELDTLAEALPENVGISVDFDAARSLGHPLVVLRPRRVERSVFESLTSREREVAELVARGLRNRDIAEALGISRATVKDHVHRILTKSGLDGRTMVARTWLAEHGG